MPISDALLRRRQLDLNKRTEDLQDYFERLAASHYSDMLPLWQKLDRELKTKLNKIYKQMGALQDPAKLKALQGKANHLEAYYKSIQADIDRVTLGTDAYMTGTIKGQFERAYYMNGWAVEQAAKVTASIPVLSSAQVLGVLANPWLPDGANYSRRMNVNMKLFAKDIKDNIEKAVKNGLGWNETARMISAKTGESYFRAVALARTELNRAAALGQSYSYMQNNDILDNKRWDATLDIRTAAKDAANDQQPYDLDYDTPENPGVPGQRIPNHTNCRCRWKAILSALGIDNRERIARGDGDTPTNFGERIYTKAGTYREYAKERGLPDLDDRLLKDNLKSYIRPGESLTDLNKTVKRFVVNGNGITVPKPDWITPKAVTPIMKPAMKQRPPIVEKLRDITSKYFTNGSLGGNFTRSKFAREILDASGLDKLPLNIKNLGGGTKGACSLDYRSDNDMHILEYFLHDADDRDDTYKVKTTFHELFHATSNGLKQDIGIGGCDFKGWVEVEETFTESAAHYLAKEAGITGLQPSYPQKLICNLPKLKEVDMFKDCNTIEDFGEVMVKYRIVDKNASEWRKFYDVIKDQDDPVPYILKHYKTYIDDNFDAVFDKMAENAPILKTDAGFKEQAIIAWEDANNYGYMPVGRNKASFIYDIGTAAMHAMGVK